MRYFFYTKEKNFLQLPQPRPSTPIVTLRQEVKEVRTLILHNHLIDKVMTNRTLTQTQMAVLMPLFAPLVDAIAAKVAERIAATTPTPKEPKFYSRKETAQLLHVTLPTLARLTKDGLITAKKVGSRILYETEAIDAAVKENRMFKYKRVR